MIKPTVHVLRKSGNVDLSKRLEDVAKRDTLVGVPQFDSSRPGDELNNAELAFLHTEGSPAQRIPARPFLQPSIKANIAEIAELQKRVIKSALAGKADLAFRNQEKLGFHAQILVQNWFTDPRNNFAPNAPYTIWKKGSDQPLIDTGRLRASIGYIVRENGQDAPNF